VSPSALDQVADYFKLLSEVSRLQVLCALKDGPRCVSDIAEVTGLGQANVSTKLRLLSQAGVLGRQPQGSNVYYKIVDPLIFDLCDLVSKRLIERWGEQQNHWNTVFRTQTKENHE
jgi:DNA-binding transcriptional ArsR family regulator